GVPVDVPRLDETGEGERERLNELAAAEYEQTGRLTSSKLLEANARFVEEAPGHLVEEYANMEELENGDNKE
ncbi:hypothetical protein LJC27_05965, partial [Christensenellaceae bacterium OttesenSCG-928-M15]|nr:hypothetical protein [Christensenellaceae bacterium OttesenSCG-928-M15]